MIDFWIKKLFDFEKIKIIITKIKYKRAKNYIYDSDSKNNFSINY